MPLTTFGAIMNFAEQIESQDLAFYEACANAPSLSERSDLFKQLAAGNGKNVKTVQRARRENVTEMILEGFQGLQREPYQLAPADAATLDAAAALETARQLETRAEAFCLDAAAKIKALPEAARALKLLAKKHRKHLNALNS